MQTKIDDTIKLEQFLRRSQVEKITGLARSTIYEKMAAKMFPRSVPISDGAVAWRASEIAIWQAERIAAREVA